MSIKINCPNCKSFNVELYLTNKEKVTMYPHWDFYKCKDCGNIWAEDKKVKQVVNQSLWKEKLKQIKKERIEYVKWGKLRMDDLINVLIDLFELGGNKFSKRKKRKIKNEKTKRNNNNR